MTIYVDNGTLHAALNQAGLPYTFNVNELPEPEIIAKIRAVKDTITTQWRNILDTVPLDKLARSFLVKVTAEGIEYLPEYTYDSAVRETHGDYWQFDQEEFQRRVRAALPEWADLVRSPTGYGTWVIQAKDGGVKQKLIDVLQTEVDAAYNRSREYWQESPTERYWGQYRVSTSPGEQPGVRALWSYVHFAERLNEEYMRLLRKAIHKDQEQYVIQRHDTSENFENFMRERRRELLTDEENILDMPMSEHGTLTNLTWGIEVEAAGARGVYAPEGWDRKGDGSLRSAYDDGEAFIDPIDCPENDHREYIEEENGEEVGNPDYVDEYWCSYCGEQEANDDDDTAEFVSPILHSFHSRGLEQLLSDLQNEPQNDSAGVHVHVGASHLTPKQVANVVLGYQLIEPIIEASYRRTLREYCRPRPTSDVHQLAKSAKSAKVTHVSRNSYRDNESEALYFGDRYHSVNLHSLRDHGTIEFRAMGPVYEYEHLIKWASFCREMVNSVANGAGPRQWAAVKNWDDLMALFAKYGVEYPNAQFASLRENVKLEEYQLEEV